jgi:NifU-like protein involved in Fe-S cluster formation
MELTFKNLKDEMESVYVKINGKLVEVGKLAKIQNQIIETDNTRKCGDYMVLTVKRLN